MNTTKQIKQIASRLPIVYEQCVSGYEVIDGSVVPNVYNRPVNHVRRMRKAYEQLGMDGIRGYLDSIHKLQIKRNEALKEDIASGKFTPEGHSAPEAGGVVSNNQG